MTDIGESFILSFIHIIEVTESTVVQSFFRFCHTYSPAKVVHIAATLLTTVASEERRVFN